VGVKEKFVLQAERSVLLVIDIQEKLAKAMDPAVLADGVRNTGILMDAAAELAFPAVATEQYVKGLGPTVAELHARFTAPAWEKMAFSCCGDPAFTAHLESLGRRQVIVAGMESHVCVLQTVVDLIDAGYIVHLVQDAVMSRTKSNWRMGLEAARDAGAVITSTEAVVFQLLRISGTDSFRRLSKQIK